MRRRICIRSKKCESFENIKIKIFLLSFSFSLLILLNVVTFLWKRYQYLIYKDCMSIFFIMFEYVTAVLHLRDACFSMYYTTVFLLVLRELCEKGLKSDRDVRN